LPVDDVVGRFGPVGAVAHRRSRGLDDRDLDCRALPPDLTIETNLDPPADRVDTAAFAGKSMADELCAALSEAGQVCTCIRIEAETEHGEHLARMWRHHRAFTPASVAERVRWQLEGWLAERTGCGCDPPCTGGSACPNPTGGTTGALTLLRLVPEEIEPDRGRQSGFWGGATEADERAARGLARVQGLLGPDAVVTAVLGGGRGPGDRVRLVPWGEPREPPATPRPAAPRPRRSKPSTRNAKPGSRVRTSGRSPSPTEAPAWPGRLPSPSPIIVASSPSGSPPGLPAEVVDASGAAVGVTGRSMITTAPARLSLNGGPWEEIRAWAGPWTADERWWDAAAHRRCARIQVVLVSGAAHLLTLESGRWWVEGSYD
jgi:protein ImuB